MSCRITAAHTVRNMDAFWYFSQVITDLRSFGKSRSGLSRVITDSRADSGGARPSTSYRDISLHRAQYSQVINDLRSIWKVVSGVSQVITDLRSVWKGKRGVSQVITDSRTDMRRGLTLFASYYRLTRGRFKPKSPPHRIQIPQAIADL